MLKHFIRAGLLSVIFLLFSCGSKEGSGKAKYVLTYSVFFPSTHQHAILADEWAKEINKRSEGQIRIDVFHASVLSSASDNFESVIKGVSDLGMSCFAYTRGMFPMIEGLDLPWGYINGKQASRIANDYIRTFQPEEINEVAFMFAHAHGPGILASRKLANSSKDLAGLTIRGTGVSAQMAQALQANPIGISQGDTYEALRKGVVDGTFCPIETLKGWKQGEVVNYVIQIPAVAYTTAMFVVMNKKTWEKLPEDLQKIISEVNSEWQQKHAEAWDKADEEGQEYVESLGKTFVKFSDAENEKVKQRFEGLFAEWENKLESQGLPGKKAAQFLKEQINIQ